MRSEIKKDIHHVIAIISATMVVVFLLLKIEPYNEVLEMMVFMYTVIMGPVVLFYTFFKMLDYEDGHVYVMFFALSVIGFFGSFINDVQVYKLSLIPWAAAFVYFPIMNYVRFTKVWFKKSDERTLHFSKMRKIEKMARKKYKRKITIKVMENDGHNASIAIVSPRKKPNYLIAEWEVDFKKGKVNVAEERWIGEKYKK